MSSSYINPTPQRPLPPTLAALLSALKSDIMKSVNAVRVGVIQSFNAATQEVTVKIAQQQITSEAPDGSRTLAEYPLLLNVPVFFPSGGGFTLTFPISAGDECVVLFNDRELDNWLANGPGLPPTTLRVHDLSDGIALVGLRSNPRALGGVSTATAQLRSDDGDTYVEIAGGGIVNIKAPTKVIIDTPELEVTGIFTVDNENAESTPCTVNGNIQTNGDVIADTISLKHHIHGGVQTGGGDTGGPV